MNLFWGIWEVIVNFIECFFLFFFLSKQLTYSNIKKPTIIILLLVLIIIISILNFTGIDYTLTMLIAFIIKVLYALFFDSSFARRIICGCIGGFVAILGNSLIAMILSCITNIDINETLFPGEIRFEITLLYCIIIILLYWILARIKPNDRLYFNNNHIIFMIIIILVGVFAVADSIAFAINHVRSENEIVLLIIISVAVLIMTLAIIFLFERIGRTLYKKYEVETKLKEFHLEEEYNIKTSELVKAWKHDFHNYLEVIQIYIQNENYEALRKYIKDINNDLQYNFTLAATGNSAVDAIIASKMLIANNKSIKVTTNLQKLYHFPISDTKMCVLLGNLLDNAIEACEKIQQKAKKYIDIVILKQRQMLLIKIVNSSIKDYRYYNNKLISSKTERNHGYGIERVRQIVSEFNGFIEIKPEECYFSVIVYLPLEKDNK